MPAAIRSAAADTLDLGSLFAHRPAISLASGGGAMSEPASATGRRADLRHTHVSHLIASEMDVLSISRRIGHSSPAITLAVYGHLFKNTDDQAARVMEAAFGNVLSTE